MSTENRPFGARLRAERARLGLTQAQVAVMGRVSKTTQVAYEADVHVPDLEYVSSLAKAGFDTTFLQTGQSCPLFVSATFDWDLWYVLEDTVEEWSDERGVRIPKAKLRSLMRMLYDQFVITREVDAAALNRMLQLVA